MLGKCVLIRACYHRYASFHEGNFYNSLGHLIHQPHDLKLTVYWLLGQQVYQGFHYFLRPLLRKLLLFLSLFILQALGWPFFNLLRFRYMKDFVFLLFFHINEDILRKDLRINIIVLRSDWLL